MTITGRGSWLLSNISVEPMTSIFQRTLGASCLSHCQSAVHSSPGNKISLALKAERAHCLTLHSLQSRDPKSVLLSSQLRQSDDILLLHRSLHSQCKILRTTGPKSLCKTLSAEYHITPTQRQVVNDEDVSGSQESWFRKHKMRLKAAPPAALVLGFSGLIPFIMPAAYSIITFSCGPQVAFAQVAYGACILSFLGGVRWGFAIAPNETPTSLSLVVSVIPSLVAWMGLSMPIQPGLVCIITGLALAGIVDSRFKSFPPWFRSLRFLLTTFAIFSVSITFGFSILYPPPEPEHGYNFKKLIKIAQIIVQD